MGGMSVTLELRDMPRGVLIRVKEPRNRGRIALALAAELGCGLYLSRLSLNSTTLRTLLWSVFVLSCWRSIASLFRGCDVELQVTNLEVASRGHSPGGYEPSTVSRADVTDLEYRDASGGVDVPEQPQGLYLERDGISRWNMSNCVLPQVSREQAETVIDFIHHRFPDTGALTERGSSFSVDLIEP